MDVDIEIASIVVGGAFLLGTLAGYALKSRMNRRERKRMRRSGTR